MIQIVIQTVQSFVRILAFIAIIDSITCLPFGGTWKQVGLDIDGKVQGDIFGFSVAMSADGTIFAASAPFNDNSNGNNTGHVRVFSYSVLFNAWVQVGSDIIGEAGDDLSGHSIAMSASGTTIAIGAPYNNNINGTYAGQVGVYSYNVASGNWIQVGSDVNGEATGDYFGWSVTMSADGKTFASGAIGNKGNGIASGHVRVYTLGASNRNWTQAGFDINGEAEFDNSGNDVSMSADGSIIAIGAPNNDNINGYNSGHVRVYTNYSSPRLWAQLGSDIDGNAQDDQSGISVAISADGKTIVIGAFRSGSGQVRVYTINLTIGIWTQVGLDINGEAADDQFGYSVAISADGKTIAIGAPYNDNTNGFNVGHVRVYSMNSTSGTWAQVGLDIDGEAASDLFGSSIAMSADGTTIAIGAVLNGFSTGHVRVYKYDALPTNAPSKAPAINPTKQPTKVPSKAPSKSPTKRPTAIPSRIPTSSPTKRPTKVPSNAPTRSPTKLPTKNLSSTPTKQPVKTPLEIMIPQPSLVPIPASVPIQVPFQAPQAEPTNCGIFGWNIFCPSRGKCGFLRRLLHLHGC